MGECLTIEFLQTYLFELITSGTIITAASLYIGLKKHKDTHKLEELKYARSTIKELENIASDQRSEILELHQLVDRLRKEKRENLAEINRLEVYIQKLENQVDKFEELIQKEKERIDGKSNRVE